MTSAFTGTLASYIFSSSPSVGASGAIFGLTGALLMFSLRHEHLLGRRGEAFKMSLLQVGPHTHARLQHPLVAGSLGRGARSRIRPSTCRPSASTLCTG